jgi:hypothetical protein
MMELLAKGKTFEWTSRHEANFQELKKRLTMASDQGLGCVLMQDGHVVAYASKANKET